MSWETLKDTVSGIITTNGANEITGEALRTLINNNVIPELGDPLYRGLAVPSTNPGTVEKPIWYFANANGTYTNFNGITIADECAVLKFNGTIWIKDVIFSNSAITLAPVTVNVTTAPYTYEVPAGMLVDQIAVETDVNQNIIIELETGTADIYDGALDSAEVIVFVINRKKKSGTLPIYFKSFTNPFQVKFYLR